MFDDNKQLHSIYEQTAAEHGSIGKEGGSHYGGPRLAFLKNIGKKKLSNNNVF